MGVRFDMLAFFTILEEFDIALTDEVSQISKVPFDELITTAVYAGAKSYCVEHRQRLWFTKEQVLEWVDESVIKRKDMQLIGKLWMDFMQTFDSQKKTTKAKG